MNFSGQLNSGVSDVNYNRMVCWIDVKKRLRAKCVLVLSRQINLALRHRLADLVQNCLTLAKTRHLWLFKISFQYSSNVILKMILKSIRSFCPFLMNLNQIGAISDIRDLQSEHSHIGWNQGCQIWYPN